MEAERVITVEYLEPSMAKELLFKFPDESAFGFDYEQSTIWSPLIPRGRPMGVGIRGRKPPDLCRKFLQAKLTNIKAKLMKKKKNNKNKKKNKNKSSNLKTKVQNATLETPDHKQGWGGKMFRAAAEHLRKQKRSPMQRILHSST